jgi:hypothetical protein
MMRHEADKVGALDPSQDEANRVETSDPLQDETNKAKTSDPRQDEANKTGTSNTPQKEDNKGRTTHCFDTKSDKAINVIKKIQATQLWKKPGQMRARNGKKQKGTSLQTKNKIVRKRTFATIRTIQLVRKPQQERIIILQGRKSLMRMSNHP